MRAAVVVLACFLTGCAGAAPPAPPSQAVTIENAVRARGDAYSVQVADRLAALRNCVGQHLVRTVGNRTERNMSIEVAFVACGAEETAARDFLATRSRDPAGAVASLSDYRAALKADILSRLTAAGI